jgi:glycosyltransferase involved in cell wall biosynthesis
VAQNKELPPQQKASIPELSLVMPVFDEADSLAETLAETTAALDSLAGSWELIVVDDGSTDATPAILREHARGEPRLRVLTQHGQQGYGLALRRGFDAARCLVVATTDAANRYDIRDLASLYPFLRDADMVAGYRLGRDDRGPRRISTRLLDWLAPRLLGIQARDLHCRLRLFRRSFLLMVELTRSDSLIDAEIFVRARSAGLRWAQVGVVERPRPRAPGDLPAWSAMRGLLALRRTL